MCAHIPGVGIRMLIINTSRQCAELGYDAKEERKQISEDNHKNRHCMIGGERNKVSPRLAISALPDRSQHLAVHNPIGTLQRLCA